MKVRIVARATGNCLTFIEEAHPEAFAALGKKGYVRPEPQVFGNHHQEWTLHKSIHPLHPHAFIISKADDEHQVLRYVPNAPKHNTLVWKREDGNTKQLWVINNNMIRPVDEISMNLHGTLDEAEREFKVGAELQQLFFFDVVVESLE